MERKLTEDEKKQIFEDVRRLLAEEFEVDFEVITAGTNVIEDFGGDSILFLEIFQELKKKYKFDVEVRMIGRYLVRNPSPTVGEALAAVYHIVETGEY